MIFFPFSKNKTETGVIFHSRIQSRIQSCTQTSEPIENEAADYVATEIILNSNSF